MPTITHIKIQNSAESYEIGGGSGATILDYATCTLGEVITAFQEGPVYLEREDASVGKSIMAVYQAWSSGSTGVICISGSYTSNPGNESVFAMQTVLVGGNLTDTFASAAENAAGINITANTTDGNNLNIVSIGNDPFTFNAADPTSDDHVANKKYVDDQIAALQSTIASLQANILTELDRQTLDVLENKSTS